MKALARGFAVLLLLVAIPIPGFVQTWLENAFNVDVIVTTTWTDSGIEVVTGDSLFIRAQGSVSNSAASWDGWFGPEGLVRGQSGGCVDCPLPGFPQGALIGRIGTGNPFYIGSFSSFSCDGGGVLHLGVNDNSPGGYTGTMRAFVWGGSAVPPPPVVDCDPGLCTSSMSLGSICGDEGADYVSYSANGARWFRVTVDEHNDFMLDLSARIILVPPEGADYNLYVYIDNCTSLYGSSTNPGSASEIVDMSWEDTWGQDDTRSVYIKVTCTSVAIEGVWTLHVYGNT